MRILGVIPARGGSTRIPRKNLQRCGGMTLVERAIEHAAGAKLLWDFCVSTNDGETQAHVVSALTGIPTRIGCIDRRAHLGTNDTPMVDVLRATLAELPGFLIDAVVTIQPTSPLRTSKDIDETIWQWVEPTNMGNHLCAVSVDALTGKRNGAVYVTPPRFIREGLVFRGPPEDAEYPMPHERSLDINEWADLEEARRVLGP